MKKAFAFALIALAFVAAAFVAAEAVSIKPLVDSGVSGTGPTMPDMRGMPMMPYYSVQTLRGFAFSTDSLESKPAVLVQMNYDGEDFAYLFIGKDLYRLHETGRQWVESGQVVKYEVEGSGSGAHSLVLYSGDGFGSSASGVFGGLMLEFQPSYYPYPVYAGQANGPVPVPAYEDGNATRPG